MCLAMWVAPGTRICTHRSVSAPSGAHAAAYVLERQSTITPRRAVCGRTVRSSGFQALASGPMPGRLTAIERR